MNSGAIVVLTTVAGTEESESLARRIVEARLAACVQILPMKSVYSWKDKIQTDSEHLLLMKTFAEKYAELERFIQTNHGYDVPEIIALTAERVSDGYFSWLKDYLK